LICVLATLIFSIPAVQTKLANYATDRINKDFGTNLKIDKVKVSLISWDTAIEGIYAEDEKKDTLFYINNLTTSVLDMNNLIKGQLEFDGIDLDGLLLKLKTYKGEKESNLEVFIDKLDDGKPRKEGTPPFKLLSSSVNITNSRFQLIDENLEKPKTLDFKDLNIKSDTFLILGPDVRADIAALSFQSRRGPFVEKLKTDFKYSKTQMRFDSLSIKTKESDLKGKLAFNYDRKDFKDFLNLVQVEADFADSEVRTDELNLLFNEFGSGKKITFTTGVNGTLNDLKTKKLLLFTDDTGVRGDFNFKNLFNIQEPFVLDADIKNITSSYYQLRGLLPKIMNNDNLPEFVQKLGRFTVRGKAMVTETSMDAKINIDTGIGKSYTDIQITNINNIETASYKGFVSLIDFDLGKFLDDSQLGKTTSDINVEGRGFLTETLNTEIIGKVYHLDFNGYRYKDANVSGILKEQLFDGSLISKDENFKFNFKGLADFSEENNNFNFVASVDYADFRALNFIKDSVSIFQGNINMDISGHTLDDIVGDINFTKTSYKNKNDTYYFEDFKIFSFYDKDSVRTDSINSPDIINGYLKGNYKRSELGKLIQNAVGSIYTNYKPHDITEGQKVDFNFKIYNKIVEVFFPEVKFEANTFARGSVVADEGDFKLTFKSPGIEAFGNKFDEIDVKIDNKNPLYNTYVAINDVATSFYDVKNFELINTTQKDTLFFRTEFDGGREHDDSYNFNFYHTFNEDNKSVIGLKTSDILFKGNKWIINKAKDKKNKVIINKTLDSIVISEIVMSNGEDEEVRLKGQLADSTYKDLSLQFKIVSLDKVTPDVPNLAMEGEINGKLNILQRNGDYLPSCNLRIDQFGVNDSILGNLSIGIVGNKDLSNFVVETHLLDNGTDRFSILGNIANTNKGQKANLLANFDNFKLEPFNAMGEGVITNIRGILNGNARITNDIKNPDIGGTLYLSNAGLGIAELNVDYAFAANSRVKLDKQSFHFENIGLTDTAEKTRATLDGTISHKSFSEWRLDLDVDTKNERFLVLNTSYEDEILYYGTGFLNGTGRIFGPTNALNINVNGSTARGTSLKIPLSDVGTVDDYNFINFIEKNEQTLVESERVLEEYEGLELRFDLDVTPEAEVEIVIDPSSGSALKGTGGGTILIEINTNGKFKMYGEFATATGEYRYKYGGVIDKTFTVQPAGTIIWDGEPLEAEINLEALYSLRANPAPLLVNSDFTRKIPVELILSLKGELLKPDLDFDIKFPGTNSIIKQELQYRLQDPSFEDKNAYSLLAQGAFINEGLGINTRGLAGNLFQTGTGLLNSILNGNSDNLNLGIILEQGDENPNATRREDRVGVNFSTKLGDRVLINGEFGIPVGGVGETVVAGDVEVQVLLNEEGTLSAKIFNRENEIQQFLAERQGYTQGVGLSYQVDFDTLKELLGKWFGSKKKSKKNK